MVQPRVLTIAGSGMERNWRCLQFEKYARVFKTKNTVNLEDETLQKIDTPSTKLKEKVMLLMDSQ